MRALLAGAWIAALVPLALIAGEGPLHRFEFHQRAMGTSVDIVLYAPAGPRAREAASAAFARVRELDARLSDYDPRSELRRLTRSAGGGEPVAVSDDLWRVLERAEAISRASEGAFDVTVGPLVHLWREARRSGRMPDAGSLAEARGRVGWRLLELDRDRRTVKILHPGVELDLGAVAKGYAAGEALAELRRRGVRRALVDLGGDLALGDPPPGAPGWRIGIARHEGERESTRSLCLARAAVATSGDAEQSVLIDGRRYSHIVDPRTGLGLTDRGEVTVVALDPMTADALASAASVLGPAAGKRLVESFPAAAARFVHVEAGALERTETRSWNRLAWPDDSDSDSDSDSVSVSVSVSDSAPAPDSIPVPVPVPAADPAGEKPADPDPTLTPPVRWILNPTPLPAATAASAREMKPYTETIPATGVSFDMVPIPAGTFRLGSPPAEPGREPSEGPQVEVEIEPFWIGKCEVTWDEYELWGMGYDARKRETAGEKGSARDRLADAITRPTKPYSDMTFGMGRDRFPAICMTQLAAKVYCKWLSAKTGRYYRLPTEAEWEYAGRAGTTTAYCFGDDPARLGEYAWYSANSAEKYHPVGLKKPNRWGLHDMHGNVAEWVLDRFTADGYAALAGAKRHCPLAEPTDLYPRVARGGSWKDGAARLRSAARRASGPDWKLNDPQFPQSIWYLTDAPFVGFRVVRPLRTPKAEEAKRYDVDEAQRLEFVDYMEYLAGRQ